MKNFQKYSIMSLPVIFIINGILFIIFGGIHNDNVLRYMGYGWLPLGIINLIVMFLYLKKQKDS